MWRRRCWPRNPGHAKGFLHDLSSKVHLSVLLNLFDYPHVLFIFYSLLLFIAFGVPGRVSWHLIRFIKYSFVILFYRVWTIVLSCTTIPKSIRCQRYGRTNTARIIEPVWVQLSRIIGTAHAGHIR